MENVGLILVVVAIFYVLTRLFPGDPRRKPDDQLLREYTLHLHKKARAQGRRLSMFTATGAEHKDSPAATELRRRGFDPDKAVAEKFDSRKEGRDLDWDRCRAE